MPTNPNPTPSRRQRATERDPHATERRREMVHAALVIVALVAIMAYLFLVPAMIFRLISTSAPRAGTTTTTTTTTTAAQVPLTARAAVPATTAETATFQARENATEATARVPATVTASVAPVAVTRTIRARDEQACGSRVRAGLVDICLDLDPDTYSINDRDKDRDRDNKDRDGVRRCVCNNRDRDGDVYYYPAPRDEDTRRPGGWPSYPSNPGPYSYPGAPNPTGPQVCRFYQPGEHRDLPDGGAICTRVTR